MAIMKITLTITIMLIMQLIVNNVITKIITRRHSIKTSVVVKISNICQIFIWQYSS